MATIVSTLSFNGGNYQLGYDLLSQDVGNNSSTVRLYGILNVTNNYISWTRGTASVHTASVNLATTYNRGTHTLVTADFTFTHNDEGNLTIAPGFSLNTTFVNVSGTGNITLPQIARASKPSCITYPNTTENIGPMGTKIFIHMNRKSNVFTHTVRYNWYGKTGVIAQNVTNYCDWTIPESFANDLPTTNIGQGTIYADTYHDGSLIGTESVIFKTTVANANPTFTNFTFEDINSKTLALTGNSQYNVNGYSTIRATITTANKAIANKGASMSRYRFIIGSLPPKEVAFSDSSTVNIDIANSTSGTYNIYAIDSRNNSTLVTKLASKEIDYKAISIDNQNSVLTRNNNNVGNQVTLNLCGTLWNQSFGKVTNSIKSVTYQFKKTESSSWINGTTAIKPTVSSDGNYTFSGLIASNNADTSWDIGSSYNIRITISDELSSKTVDLILNSAIPTLSLDKQGVGIMCSFDTTKGGFLQVNGKVVNTEINDTYSLQELKTNKIWINNKPIYRKVVQISKLPNNNVQDFSTNLSNVTTINVDYYFLRQSDGLILINTVNIQQIQVRSWGSTIRIITNSDLSEYTGYVTLEYFKN